MSYNDRQDVETLLYTTTVCNSGEHYTLPEFRMILKNQKLYKEMVYALERKTAMMSQFQQSESDPEKNTESSPATDIYIKDIVSTLILNGLNAHYALYEMEICDISLYLQALDNHRREEMERDRLWTFIGMLPHVDGKKIASPKSIYLFPWEEDKEKEAAQRSLMEDKEKFERFLKEGKNLFKNK